MYFIIHYSFFPLAVLGGFKIPFKPFLLSHFYIYFFNKLAMNKRFGQMYIFVIKDFRILLNYKQDIIVMYHTFI